MGGKNPKRAGSRGGGGEVVMWGTSTEVQAGREGDLRVGMVAGAAFRPQAASPNVRFAPRADIDLLPKSESLEFDPWQKRSITVYCRRPGDVRDQ